MDFFSAEPTPSSGRLNEDWELSKELDTSLENMIRELREIMKHPHLIDNGKTLQTLSSVIIHLHEPSKKAAKLELE